MQSSFPQDVEEFWGNRSTSSWSRWGWVGSRVVVSGHCGSATDDTKWGGGRGRNHRHHKTTLL